MFIFASQWDNHPFFSLGALALQRAISGPFGIYEVLTAPHGRLSGSHITLDLPAHERNTHQTTQTHRWSPHRQPAITLFNYRHAREGPLLSCQHSVTQRIGEEPERDGRQRIPASKTWKTQRTASSIQGNTHTVIATDRNLTSKAAVTRLL